MRINSVFVIRKIYNIYILVPIKNNTISNNVIHLNSTVALIFLNCNKFNDVDSLAKNLSYEFLDEDKEQIIKVLKSYINDLIEQKYILL